MSINVIEVKSRKLLNEFIKLPWYIYKNDKYWVPKLISEEKKLFNPENNPYYEHADVALFIAQKDGKTVGRISAHIDYNHIDFHDENVGFFGFFECINDIECAKSLFETASDYLRKRGMPKIRGPYNFSTNNEVGLLVDGFDDPPCVMMTYNPKYYIGLIEKLGYYKAKDIYAYIIPEIKNTPERLAKIAERIKQKESFVIRPINIKNLKSEVKLIRDIYNSAWENNWGFVPMTEHEFDHLAEELKMIIDPDIAFVAECDNKPVGFSLTIPDVNFALKHVKSGKLFPFGLLKLLYWSKKIKRIRVITLGVIKEYRKRGIELAFYYETFKNSIKNKYKSGEMSWILEDNFLMRKGIEDIGGKIYKTYRFYEKQL